MKLNNQFYTQIKRTRMGTIFLSTYATLAMGCFEIKICSACNFKYGEFLAACASFFI